MKNWKPKEYSSKSKLSDFDDSEPESEDDSFDDFLDNNED